MNISRYKIKPQDFQKLNSKLLYISMSKYGGDQNNIPHTYHFTELFYVISREDKFWLENKTYPISPDDLITVPPNTGHTELSYNANPLGYTVLGVRGITFLGSETSSSHDIYNYPRWIGLSNLLDLILKEVQNKQPGYHLICQNLLDILLVQIIHHQKLAPAPIGFTKMTRECGQIKQYLDSNYADSINLNSLAATAHMNRYYLIHTFTRYMGFSPINCLNAKRLKSSRNLLTSTDSSITQVASSIGFSPQSYFSQASCKKMNVTPGEYRKRKSTESESETPS